MFASGIRLAETQRPSRAPIGTRGELASLVRRMADLLKECADLLPPRGDGTRSVGNASEPSEAETRAWP